jgi:hypothetical protein
MSKQLITLNKTSLRKNLVKKQLDQIFGDAIFDFKTWDDLLYHSLKLFSPVNEWIEATPNSILKACITVNKQLGLNLKATLYKLTDDGKEEIKSPESDPVTKFRENVLQFDELPHNALFLLQNSVKDDLEEINELIAEYENTKIIQDHLKNNGFNRSHENRITIDFYTRCIEERKNIEKYLNDGIKQRALDKAAHKWPLMSSEFMAFMLDRPYYFALPYGREYFDVKRIDLVSHRLGEFPIQPDKKLENLYKNEKAAFYQYYFDKIPVEQHFINFKWFMAHLPLVHDRKKIFEELEQLYKNEHWIGFYALALPQVEGLFSEMCVVIDPDGDHSQAALPSKVRSVRPYYALSQSYFDYFQYLIPLQRNKFAHTGYDEDFQLKSYDLLSDLNYLLSVFNELDNALVKIKKLHTKRDFMRFVNIPDFAAYFRLLDDLKPVQKKQVKTMALDFEKNFLLMSCSLDFRIEQLENLLPAKIDELTDKIAAEMDHHNYTFDFKGWTIPKIKEALKDAELKDRLEMIFTFKSRELSQLADTRTFLGGHKRHLPNLPAIQKKTLNKLAGNYSPILAKIDDLNKLLQD